MSRNTYESPAEPKLIANPRGNNLLRGVNHGIGLAVISIFPLFISALVREVFASNSTGGYPSYPEALIFYLRRDGLPLTLILPLLAFSTGVASAAPNHRYSYGSTLALIFSFSVAGIFLLSQFNMSPPLTKGSSQPDLYLSEVVMFCAPIVVATTIITLLRWAPNKISEDHP